MIKFGASTSEVGRNCHSVGAKKRRRRYDGVEARRGEDGGNPAPAVGPT